MRIIKKRKHTGKIKALIGLILTAGVAVLGFHLTHADASNLVANGDFETASSDPGTPLSWFQDSWGQNTAAFSYLNEGHGGSHAVRVAVSNYQDGDGKWLFNAVDVAAGARYDYTDWYRASASTNLWARFELQNGSVQYQWLKVLPVSSDWAQGSVTVTVPSGVARMSIFHVLNANGQLDMDDVSIKQQQACNPANVNGLVNGSFEETCAQNTSMPAGWQTQSFGSVPATFAYTTNAHQGAHAVSITNTSQNTEGGWTTTISSPAPSQRYSLSFWQSGTTYAYAYLTETMTDGSSKDVSLMSVPATNNVWSQYQDVLVTPANIQSIKLTIATSGSGTVTLDDVSLQPLANQAPPTFTSGMASVTFDDGLASSYTNGVSVMAANGFLGTYYLNGGALGTRGYMTETQVKNLATAGHEIGSHLFHHSDIVQLDTPTLISELTGNRTTIQEILGANYQVNSFASPYGSYTSGAIDTVMQYAKSHRDTDGELNTKANLNPRQIHGRLVTASTTLTDIKSWITEAQTTKSWLVLVYHGIAAGTDANSNGEAGYQVTPTAFKNQMAALKQSGVTVKPVNTALTTLQSQ